MKWTKVRGKPYVCPCGKKKIHSHGKRFEYPAVGSYAGADGVARPIVETGGRKPYWRVIR